MSLNVISEIRLQVKMMQGIKRGVLENWDVREYGNSI